jgi:mannosyltransferase
VLCAAGAVFVVAHLGARVYGRTIGLLAALLVALSPFHLFYAQEVRFYSFIELLVSTERST